MVVGSTAGPAEVNITTSYPAERPEQWDPERRGCEENIAGG